jgi:cellulose synthase (UDP-forming)
MSLLIATRKLRPHETGLALLWVGLVVPLALLASIPTSVAVQGGLGVFAVVAVAALKPFANRHILARFLLLAIASAVVMRYWFWRVSETLPAPENPVSYTIAIALSRWKPMRFSSFSSALSLPPIL